MASSFKNVIINDTGYLTLPVGTTAQRPSASAGMTRYNSTQSAAEVYNGGISSWEDSSISWSTPAGSLGVIPDRSVTNYNAPFTVKATGPGTITYTVSKGNLPNGMSLNTSTGVISGDPYDVNTFLSTSVFTFPFTIRATSSLGGYKDRQFAITLSGGGGRGKTITDGTDSLAVSNYLAGANANFNYYIDSWYGSAGAGGDLLKTSYAGGSFSFHTGHNGNSTQWPMHFCLQVTSNPNGKVLNRVQWYKHANACGNCNMWGTNYPINSNNFNNTSLYTFLGRVFMGGYGSSADGTLMTDYFNADNLGFKYYMIQVMDMYATRLPYPNYGNWGGWAMYGITFDKV